MRDRLQPAEQFKPAHVLCVEDVGHDLLDFRPVSAFAGWTLVHLLPP
jgi:hypothetical protein